MGKLKPFSALESSSIIEDYTVHNKTIMDIAKFYKRGTGNIIKLLKSNNIEIKGRKGFTIFNKNYFDTVNTEKKAYILGFLYADGYNQSDPTHSNVRLVLQYSDYQIINDISKELDHKNGPNLTKNNQWQIVFSSNHFSNKLTELGCMRAKSLILKFPTFEQVPDHLMRHFIRGYLDGDGWIYYNKKNKQFQAGIMSTENFCKEFQKYIFSKLNLKIGKLTDHQNNNISKMCRYSGQNSIILLDWLFDGASIYLDRKYKKYLQVKEFFLERNGAS